MRKLYVFYEAQRVGELEQEEDLRLRFTYAGEWLMNQNSFPLSLRLPLQAERFDHVATLSFFENLLPEGEIRKSVENAQRITGVFDFLTKYGQDCAGAVIVSTDSKYHAHVDPSSLIPVEMAKIYQAIEEKRSVFEEIANLDPGYLSLPGAQDKFPAVYKNGAFFFPAKGGATTHIVKVPVAHSGVRESVYNEYFCTQLAQKADLLVPHTFVLDEKQPLFIVERYDRYKDEKGIVHRIHQQDFCQAQGIPSEKKYEEKGGPSLKDNYQLIVNNVSPKRKIKDARVFLRWICFNLLIGNNDCHSKNISLLSMARTYQLAPFYDLVCTSIYPKLKSTFPFQIGDRNEFSKIGLKQFRKLEEALDIKPNTMVESLGEMATKILEHRETLSDEILKMFPQTRITKEICAEIDRRIKSLRLQKALK